MTNGSKEMLLEFLCHWHIAGYKQPTSFTAAIDASFTLWARLWWSANNICQTNRMSPPRMIFYPKEVTDQLPPKTAGVSFFAIWGFWARFAAKQFNHQLTDLYSYVFQKPVFGSLCGRERDSNHSLSTLLIRLLIFQPTGNVSYCSNLPDCGDHVDHYDVHYHKFRQLYHL